MVIARYDLVSGAGKVCGAKYGLSSIQGPGAVVMGPFLPDEGVYPGKGIFVLDGSVFVTHDAKEGIVDVAEDSPGGDLAAASVIKGLLLYGPVKAGELYCFFPGGNSLDNFAKFVPCRDSPPDKYPITPNFVCHGSISFLILFFRVFVRVALIARDCLLFDGRLTLNAPV
jgi:hypothetical protein